MNNKQPEQKAFGEFQVKINQALQELPHENRMAVILSDLEGFSSRQIAEILSCSEKKAVKRLQKGHRQLQKTLNPYLAKNPIFSGAQWEIKDLLLWKKLETPGAEYFEHFTPEFHRYQRASILNEANVFGEFFSNFSAFLFSIPRPVTAMASVMAIFVVVAIVGLPGQKDSSEPTFVSVPKMDRVVEDVLPVEKKNFVDVSASYSDPLVQQPELHRPILEESHDMSAPRYVTGNSSSSYDTTLAF